MRIAILVAAIALGVLMWLALNRTRIGMLIRAGVDDRDMLAASGVRIQFVFVAVFAFGAGLAGIAGIVGGTFQSISPGEDVRFLLASLVVVIVGGMGSILGAALGALLIGLAEQLGLGLRADLFGGLHLPDHGLRAGLPAAGPAAAGADMAIAESRDTPIATATPRAPSDTFGLAPADPDRLVDRRRAPAADAGVASGFVLYQIFGWAFILGMIALSLMFLAGYGGMVSLAQMSVAALAGYMVAILGTSGIAGDQPRLAVVALRPGRDRDRGALRDRDRRARGAHRGHLHDHDHARDRGGVLLFHAAELRRSSTAIAASPASCRRACSASTGGNRFHSTISRSVCAAVAYLAVVYVSRSPFGLALQGVRDNPAPHGGARVSTSPRTASPPTPSPA